MRPSAGHRSKTESNPPFNFLYISLCWPGESLEPRGNIDDIYTILRSAVAIRWCWEFRIALRGLPHSDAVHAFSILYHSSALFSSIREHLNKLLSIRRRAFRIESVSAPHEKAKPHHPQTHIYSRLSARALRSLDRMEGDMEGGGIALVIYVGKTARKNESVDHIDNKRPL